GATQLQEKLTSYHPEASRFADRPERNQRSWRRSFSPALLWRVPRKRNTASGSLASESQRRNPCGYTGCNLESKIQPPAADVSPDQFQTRPSQHPHHGSPRSEERRVGKDRLPRRCS